MDGVKGRLPFEQCVGKNWSGCGVEDELEGLQGDLSVRKLMQTPKGA